MAWSCVHDACLAGTMIRGIDLNVMAAPRMRRSHRPEREFTAPPSPRKATQCMMNMSPGSTPIGMVTCTRRARAQGGGGRGLRFRHTLRILNRKVHTQPRPRPPHAHLLCEVFRCAHAQPLALDRAGRRARTSSGSARERRASGDGGGEQAQGRRHARARRRRVAEGAGAPGRALRPRPSERRRPQDTSDSRAPCPRTRSRSSGSRSTRRRTRSWRC